jgi:hypothetical protein
MLRLHSNWFAIVSLLFASVSFAQVPATPDAKEIQSYTLTVSAMKQVMTATRNMLAAAKSDPRYQRLQKLEAEAKALSEKEEPTDADTERLEKIQEEMDAARSGLNFMSGNKSLDEIEAAIKKEPIAVKAMQSAGIAPRDYAKFFAAFLQASFIHGFQKSGMLKEMPKEANPENVKFVEQHAGEFEAFMKELQAFAGKQP